MEGDQLIFVTGNPNKAREAAEILDFPVVNQKLDLIEIQSMDIHEILRHKLEQAYAELKTPLIVEDAGLFVDAWQGFPGPFIKYVETHMGYGPFIQALEDNRKATHVVCIGYHDGAQTHIFEGRHEGTISREERGVTGFGFDVCFIPEGYDKTFAELGPEIKNKISARRQALDQLRMHLIVSR